MPTKIFSGSGPTTAQIRADVDAYGESLGFIDPAASPLVSQNENDFFFNSADGNALYKATAAGQSVSAFVKQTLPDGGTIIGEADTFADFPAVINGKYALLRADDIGTGTAEAPQYRQGVYKGVSGAWVPQLAPQTAEENDTNTISGIGPPTAAVGVAGNYYRQLDTEIGKFRVWGPRTATAWPAEPTIEITPDPGNAQTYLFTRTDNSTALPSPVETAPNPKLGDIANGLLFDGRRIWWRHDGTDWVQTRIDPSASGAEVIDDFTPTNNQTVFTLSVLPKNAASARLVINSAVYYNPAHITVSGQTVTWNGLFSIAPNDEVRAIYT